jgi:hypothetical protein
MPILKRTALINAIWAAIGLSVGACVATVVDGRWTPEWVGATGTWFGGVATATAVALSLAAFRAEQTNRERTRVAEREAEQKIAEDRALAELAEAELFTMSLVSSGGYGDRSENFVINAVVLEIWNLSGSDAMMTSMTLDQALRPKKPLPNKIYVEPLGSRLITIEVEDVASPAGFDTTALATFSMAMNYRVGGRSWHRSAGEAPVPR